MWNHYSIPTPLKHLLVSVCNKGKNSLYTQLDSSLNTPLYNTLLPDPFLSLNLFCFVQRFSPLFSPPALLSSVPSPVHQGAGPSPTSSWLHPFLFTRSLVQNEGLTLCLVCHNPPLFFSQSLTITSSVLTIFHVIRLSLPLTRRNMMNNWMWPQRGIFPQKFNSQ